MTSWAGLVVERLAELRAAEGPNFDRHFAMALQAYPARGEGVSTPRLFEEDGRPAEGLVTFLRRVAEDAYYDVRGQPGSGNGPRIRDFRVEMVREVDAAPALRSTSSHGRYRMAA
jgi:hypothetical protein